MPDLGQLSLHVLLVLTTALHLLIVNVAAAGPLVCGWLAWRGRHDPLARDVGLWLLARSIAALFAGAIVGGVSLGLLWLLGAEPYFHALEQLPLERYAWGGVELLFTAACYGGWLWLWRRGRFAMVQGLLALLGATNVLYHFPTLFAVLTTLSVRPQIWEAGMRFTQLLADQTVLARVLHFLLASVAVTGMMLMGYALRMMRHSEPSNNRREQAARVARWGGRIALVPTLLQWLAGLYLLLSLPPATRDLLLGGRWDATALFAAALLATVLLMHKLAAAALGDASRQELVGSMSLVSLVVLLMVAAWHTTRLGVWQ